MNKNADYQLSAPLAQAVRNVLDLTQMALDGLADVGLGNDSPAEAYIIGWRDGWDKALAYAIRVEEALDEETA